MQPKDLSQSFLEQYFSPGVFSEKSYTIEQIAVRDKLDQNESPSDWPAELKAKVLENLATMEWNRYPSPFGEEISNRLAAYAGVTPKCILTGAGSNTLLTLLFRALTQSNKGKVVIARPSFPHYENFFRLSGRKFETWPLNETLDYDIALLPDLPSGSVVVFASPNNPVGNSLSKSNFEHLLQKHPNSFFIADEAYFEFAEENYGDFLARYPNFISVRTCSKTLGSAGVRLGYAISCPAMIEQLKKFRIPYVLNQFTVAAAQVLLGPEFLSEELPNRIKVLKIARNNLFNELRAIGEPRGVWIKESQANFVLARWPNQSYCEKSYRSLLEEGILVRNISQGPMLEACLRISVGLADQNERLISAARKYF